MPAERRHYAPEGGMELREDDSVLDVTKWREDQIQQRGGDANVRAYDPKLEGLMNSMLKELRAIKNEIFLMRNGE